ncbi:hypothetical protein L3Q65_01010 (plasmid) [Amycolatopsis sp. FU40]|uniref:hypothetical protein n=1 Tax=Amycolatopsis sp. FU40 TaxID=2914159 RepID=UPI001F3165A7|nr:hypothetical protein [Amycolatopsis sp. FU40]UKD50905.1 hypothetical protein L3Q65_01010 [Amycolatopsis sp. FU40]
MHSENGLGVRVGHRRDPDLLPQAIAEHLIAPSGPGTSADPAHDLIALEARFRADIAEAATGLAVAEKLVQQRRTDLAAARSRLSPVVRRRRKQAEQDFAAATAQHATAATALERCRRLQRMLRDYVIGLNLRSGRLAEAARGWSRSPETPGSAIVFDSEELFLAADPRRADPAFGIPLLTGDDFGRQWRRDGDEDPAVAPERSGTWTVLYLPRAGEICATRRHPHLENQVWLLGSGLFDPAAAHTVLTDLETRMREPNSLILVAERVHAARIPGSPPHLPVPAE